VRDITTAALARDYVEKLGWVLIPIPPGQKGPNTMGWNTAAKALTTPAAAHKFYTDHHTYNMGLFHSMSGTMALDIDHLENFRTALVGFGIDVDAVLASAPGIIGRPGRGKLIFRVPEGVVISTHKISWPVLGDPRRTEVVFEIRVGAVQDVLPPSIHPDTGLPYQWTGPSIWNGIPMAPDWLILMATQWDRFRPQLMDACPWATKQVFNPPRPKRVQNESTSVIDTFNGANSIGDTLLRYGYKQTAPKRFLSPNSTTGMAGVVLFDDGKAYSHHASDPFDPAHTFDAFDLFVHYEHGGDVKAAVKDAAGILQIDNVPEHTYDPEAAAHGKSVYELWQQDKPKPDDTIVPGVPDHLLSIPGALQEAVDYYTATAPRSQPQFAVQTALAFGSVVMGRRWVTDCQNYSGLYFVNVAVTAAGKEHAKTVLEDLMEAAKLEALIGPSGYTSASGVFSALTSKPVHIAIIDELGRMLQASSAKGASPHKAEAQTQLMEVFGRMHKTLRPLGYATNNLRPQDAAQFERVVRRPSLTLMALTTPETLYNNLSSALVKDGFIGRFLIVQSHLPRKIGTTPKSIDPPQPLLAWAKACAEADMGTIPGPGSHDLPPDPVVVPFAPECAAMLVDFEQEVIDQMNHLEKFGLHGMYGRTKEIAMRIALIVAVSAGEKAISGASLRWALDYTRHYTKATVAALRGHMSEGDFASTCKQVMAALAGKGLKGLTEAELSGSIGSFKNMKPRERVEVFAALKVDHGVLSHITNSGQRGRPRLAYYIDPGDPEE
jgi:hypothetical protein